MHSGNNCIEYIQWKFSHLLMTERFSSTDRSKAFCSLISHGPVWPKGLSITHSNLVRPVVSIIFTFAILLYTLDLHCFYKSISLKIRGYEFL